MILGPSVFATVEYRGKAAVKHFQGLADPMVPSLKMIVQMIPRSRHISAAKQRLRLLVPKLLTARNAY